MDINQKSAIIKQFSLFNSLTGPEFIFISQNAKPVVFLPHKTIISQDNSGEGIFLIYKGLIRIFILSEEGKVIPIKVKSHPYVIGIVDVISHERESIVEAIIETKALFIPKVCFLKIIQENVQVTYSVLQLVTKKLRETNFQTEYYFSSTLKDRTLHVLKELAPFFSENTITLSHEEIADIVGATRARVTEVLDELSEQGIISISQRKILVLRSTASA